MLDFIVSERLLYVPGVCVFKAINLHNLGYKNNSTLKCTHINNRRHQSRAFKTSFKYKHSEINMKSL